MHTPFFRTPGSLSVYAQERRATITWWLWFLSFMGVTGMVGLSMLRNGSDPAILGWFVYFAGIVAILYQPRFGIYLIVGFTLVGDASLIWWYPFVKNFSSGESLFYVNGSLIFSPFESYVVLILLSWLGRIVISRQLGTFYTGTLFWPALVFMAFLAFGLGYGIMGGGSLNTALWECRPIFYLPIMLVVVSNLLETRAHINYLLWIAMIALFIEGVVGSLYVANTLHFELSTVERIAEHSLSIHANTFFIFTIAAWIYHTSITKRIVLPLMLPVVALTFLANQRRAGFITLFIALALIGVILYRERRKLFWYIAPIACFVGVAYIGVFWNSSGTLGMPASAVKSVIAPDESSADQASNLYRIIENINTMFTIKSVPLTGIGFGNKFYIIVPMPDISFFIWWEYIVHNSIMWMWVKTGIGGFLSMLFLVGLSIIKGMRTLWRMPPDTMSAVTLTATLYIMMHFIFAYVDMSWDNQSMIYVGTMMGIINCIERIVARPEPGRQKRWPWQPEPHAIPGLRLVAEKKKQV